MRVRVLTLWLIVMGIATLSASLIFAQDYNSRIRNLPTERAYDKLLNAEIFNLGGVGWGLTITPEEKAFRKLLESQNPLVLFHRLLREGNPEGQLYALYGLYLWDPQAFKAEAERLKNDKDPPARREGLISIEKGQIRFGHGCILSRKDRRILIEEMAHGDFDQAFRALSAPKN